MGFAFTSEFDRDLGFEKVEEKLITLMKDKGFGVLTEINVKAVLKEKLDLDKKPYKILGFCNPPRANKVLDADGDVGIFLPCNGVIYDTGESIKVVLTDADSMFALIDNDEIAPVAKEVSTLFSEVQSELEAAFN